MNQSIELDVIHNENCLDTMSRMPDGAVDLVLTSPPYNMNLRIMNGKYVSRQIVKEFSTKYESFDDNMPIDEFHDLHLKILDELLRVSKIVFYNIQIVTGSKRAFFRMIGERADMLKDIIVWDKGVAQPAMQESVLNRQSELVLVFEREGAISRMFRKSNFKRGTLGDIWEIPRSKKVSDSHGAVFPEELAVRVLENFTSEGDVVYDPFMGSGTTGKVASVMGRRFIGSEISPEYCEIARRRIEEGKLPLLEMMV